MKSRDMYLLHKKDGTITTKQLDEIILRKQIIEEKKKENPNIKFIDELEKEFQYMMEDRMKIRHERSKRLKKRLKHKK